MSTRFQTFALWVLFFAGDFALLVFLIHSIEIRSALGAGSLASTLLLMNTIGVRQFLEHRRRREIRRINRERRRHFEAIS